MAFELAALTAFVAGLNINATLPDNSTKAITMLDFFSTSPAIPVPDEITPRLCPCFYADPNKQIQAQTVQRNSFGTGATARQTLVYLVPFVLLYQPSGGERRVSTITPGLAATVKALVNGILNNDKPPDPAFDLFISSFTLLGQMLPDIGYNPETKAGGLFHGCPMVLQVMEYIN